MVDGAVPNLKETRRKVTENTAHALGGFRLRFEKIDQRTVVGLVFLLLALVLVSAPNTGTIDWLADHGISPRGYGYGLAVLGGLILRYPRSKLYGLFTLGFWPYLLGTIAFALEGSINPGPIILYSALYYFMLRAD